MVAAVMPPLHMQAIAALKQEITSLRQQLRQPTAAATATSPRVPFVPGQPPASGSPSSHEPGCPQGNQTNLPPTVELQQQQQQPQQRSPDRHTACAPTSDREAGLINLAAHALSLVMGHQADMLSALAELQSLNGEGEGSGKEGLQQPLGRPSEVNSPQANVQAQESLKLAAQAASEQQKLLHVADDNTLRLVLAFLAQRHPALANALSSTTTSLSAAASRRGVQLALAEVRQLLPCLHACAQGGGWAGWVQ